MTDIERMSSVAEHVRIRSLSSLPDRYGRREHRLRVHRIPFYDIDRVIERRPDRRGDVELPSYLVTQLVIDVPDPNQ